MWHGFASRVALLVSFLYRPTLRSVRSTGGKRKGEDSSRYDRGLDCRIVGLQCLIWMYMDMCHILRMRGCAYALPLLSCPPDMVSEANSQPSIPRTDTVMYIVTSNYHYYRQFTYTNSFSTPLNFLACFLFQNPLSSSSLAPPIPPPPFFFLD